MTAPKTTATPAVGAAETKPLSQWQRFARRFVRQRGAMVALGYILILVIIAVFADVLAPYPQDQQDLGASLAMPFTPGHLLGADMFGRDTLSRLI